MSTAIGTIALKPETSKGPYYDFIEGPLPFSASPAPPGPSPALADFLAGPITLDRVAALLEQENAAYTAQDLDDFLDLLQQVARRNL